MLTRPWPIRLLATLFVLAPLLNAVALSFLWDVSLLAYLRVVFLQPWWSVLEICLPLPAAGLAIYAMKRWSYVVFLLITAYVFVRNAQNVHGLPDSFNLPVLILAYAVNLVVVAYFLLPTVRGPYFNARMRWWEALPRYRLDLPIALHRGEQVVQVRSNDFSAGGVLVRASDDIHRFFEPGEGSQHLRVEFRHGEKSEFEFSLPATRVHHRRSGDDFLYGLQYTNLSRTDRRLLLRFVRELQRSGHVRLQNPPPLWTDFRGWLRTVGNKSAWIPTSGAPKSVPTPPRSE